MNDTKKCDGCGAVNPKQAKFCGGCGTAFPVEVKRPDNCPNCGVPLPATIAFCFECGAKIEAAPSVPPKAEEKPVRYICDRCGSTSLIPSRYCEMCGGAMKPVFAADKPEKKPAYSGEALKSRAEKPRSDKRKRWWIIGISAFLLCGIVGGILSLILGNGVLTEKVDIDDFISAFEDAGYEMYHDDYYPLSDFEDEYGVSTGIETFAAYDGYRSQKQNGWQLDDSITFYYVKCEDEETAAIVFDAIRDDEMYEDEEVIRNRNNSEKVRSESEGYSPILNGQQFYDKGSSVVVREGNVVVFLDADFGQFYKYGIAYDNAAEKAMEDLGF